MIKKFQIVVTLTILIMLCMPVLSIAAGPGFGGGMNDGGGACAAPIDGGTGALLVAGAGYVSRMLFKKKRKAEAVANK